MRFDTRAIALSMAMACSSVLAADPVVDQDKAISERELLYALEHIPGEMREELRDSPARRFQFISSLLAGKRFLARASELGGEDDSDIEFELELQAVARKFMEKRFLETLDVPDMEQLAQEKYRAEKEEMAFVPEKRRISHILLRCDIDSCESEALGAKLDEIKNELTDPTSFGALAKLYSDDPDSFRKGGVVDASFSADDSRVLERLRVAVFAAPELGIISEPVRTKVGYHIVRVDEIAPSYYRDYEDIKDKVIAILEKRYRQERLQEYVESFGATEKLVVDDFMFNMLLEEAFDKAESDG